MNRSPLSPVWLLALMLLAGQSCEASTDEGPGKPRPAPPAQQTKAEAPPPDEASAAGFFTPVAPMRVARSGHSATLLQDGRVLVAGGYGKGYMDQTELWDPAKNQWTESPSMKGKRAYHAARLLPDGRVIVLGGSSFDGADRSVCESPFSRTEFWNPGMGLWTLGPCLNHLLPTNDAGDPAVALLPDGQLFASTGASDMFDPSYVELWSPSTERWKVVGEFPRRKDFSLALLANGHVLMAGGNHTGTGGRGETTAQLWDPKKKAWSPTRDLPLGRRRARSVRLTDGRVLILGGHLDYAPPEPGKGPRNAILFEPATGTWKYAPSLTTATETQHQMVLLPSGSVLLFNGGQAFVWNPKEDRWRPAGGVAQMRTGYTLTSLGDGRALICGGSNGEAFAVCDLWQPRG